MFAMLKQFFQFLFPILRITVLEDASYARPRPRSYNENDCPECGRSLGTPHYSYCSQFIDLDNLSSDEALTKLREKLTGQPAERKHFNDVVMVAFHLDGRSASDVHNWLHTKMPQGDYTYNTATYGKIHLDSWWVAEDERFDRSDCDSAVFVSKGNQVEARKLLREHGLLS